MGFFTTNSDSEKENVPSHGLPVPGTVHLVDLEGTMRAKHAKGSLHDVVLVPAPSADPDDPVSKKFLFFSISLSFLQSNYKHQLPKS